MHIIAKDLYVTVRTGHVNKYKDVTNFYYTNEPDSKPMLCISSTGAANLEDELSTTVGCQVHDRYFAQDVVSVVLINR